MSGCRLKHIWLHTPEMPGGALEKKYFAQFVGSLAERKEINMKVYILKDITTEGLGAKINQVAEKVQGAVNNIQYQAVVVPQFRGKEIVDVKMEYSAMMWVWE